MHDLNTFTDIILALDKSGDLELKVSKDKLRKLVNNYLIGNDSVYNDGTPK